MQDSVCYFFYLGPQRFRRRRAEAFALEFPHPRVFRRIDENHPQLQQGERVP
jgi:hypothetical protein